MDIDSFISRLAAKVAVNSPEEADDYIQDGLRYCGKCHTPKEHIIQIPGRDGKIRPRHVPVICHCRSEVLRTLKEKEQEAERIRDWQRIGNISPVCTFQNAEKTKEISICERYAEKWDEISRENISLLFWGDNRTGKSFAAQCVCNALIVRGVRTYCTSLATILNSGDMDKSAYLEKMKNRPLVVIDDLGAERVSVYGLEVAFAVIDERVRAQKPMIVTTNLTKDELKSPPDLRFKRIYDRILESCTHIHFQTHVWRDQRADEKTRAAKRILGL